MRRSLFAVVPLFLLSGPAYGQLCRSGPLLVVGCRGVVVQLPLSSSRGCLFPHLSRSLPLLRPPPRRVPLRNPPLPFGPIHSTFCVPPSSPAPPWVASGLVSREPPPLNQRGGPLSHFPGSRGPRPLFSTACAAWRLGDGSVGALSANTVSAPTPAACDGGRGARAPSMAAPSSPTCPARCPCSRRAPSSRLR